MPHPQLGSAAATRPREHEHPACIEHADTCGPEISCQNHQGLPCPPYSEPHPQCAHPQDHCLQGVDGAERCSLHACRMGLEWEEKGGAGGQHLHWHPALSPAGVHGGLHEE